MQPENDETVIRRLILEALLRGMTWQQFKLAEALIYRNCFGHDDPTILIAKAAENATEDAPLWGGIDPTPAKQATPRFPESLICYAAAMQLSPQNRFTFTGERPDTTEVRK